MPKLSSLCVIVFLCVCTQVDEQISANKQCNCLGLLRKVGEENMILEDEAMELRSVVKKMKEEKMVMIQAHIRELRRRDLKEIGLYVVLVALGIVYLLCALF